MVKNEARDKIALFDFLECEMSNSSQVPITFKIMKRDPQLDPPANKSSSSSSPNPVDNFETEESREQRYESV